MCASFHTLFYEKVYDYSYFFVCRSYARKGGNSFSVRKVLKLKNFTTNSGWVNGSVYENFFFVETEW